MAKETKEIFSYTYHLLSIIYNLQCMSRIKTDEGLIIKKTSYPGNIVRVVIFTKSAGKLVLFAHGAQKLTSRRISHIEIGNYLKFSSHASDKRLTLGETDMQYAHSGVKNSLEKLSVMYDIFFVLEKLLPEGQGEKDVFIETKNFLKKLNKQQTSAQEERNYFKKILMQLGYIDIKSYESASFDEVAFIEELIGKKIATLGLH